MDTAHIHPRLRLALLCLPVLAAPALSGCDDGEDLEDPELAAQIAADELADLRDDDAPPVPLTSSELSQLVLGGAYPVTNGYAPNGVHAGVDFGSTGNGVTSVSSPVNGTIVANTDACGKVAIYDGSNTVIVAHMTSRTTLPVGSSVSIGTYLGKASNVVGGGCTATGAHLHLEIRTGKNASMAAPGANNSGTTLDPLSYGYSPFNPVTLLTPTSGTTVNSNPVWLEWKFVQGATAYRVQISRSNSFTANGCTSGCVVDNAGSSTNRSFNLGAGTYYWRVRAGNSGQGGLWSPVRWFKKI